MSDDDTTVSPSTGATAAGRVWQTFRSWPWWGQALLWLFFLPFVLVLLALTKPAGKRLPWFGAAAASALMFGAIVAVTPEDEAPVETADAATTTTEDVEETPSSERITTTTERDESPEGATRAGDRDVDDALDIDDALDRGDATSADVDALNALTVEPEYTGGGYHRVLFPHWDDDDRDGCDTRCEVLTAQRQDDGSWYSAWDGTTETDSSLVHIDHIVALSEAWDSGAHDWFDADRDAFADDRANLIAVTASANLRKSDKDAAEWFPSNSDANCLWARTVVAVKTKWELSVDQAEKTALANLLNNCGAAPTTTAAPATTQAPATPRTPAPTSPPPTTSPPTTQAPPPNCTPGYSPCLPPAEDYDCAGGSGNGPEYVNGPVYVDHAYGDPYDLDRDGDGVGCEN